ncbi:ferric iron ABC transporter membrane-spanning permease [Streptococcus pneumoniae]|nr:ferric iron ABC transporter membrane-spanning permease [Streptococcus pneumoniae]
MKLSHYLIGLLLLLVFLSISIGTSDFSWGKLFDFDQQTWLLFQESRLPRTISILLTASSMSMAGLLMQTITQNQFAAPSTVGTTEAAKLGMVLSLFVFPSASLTQKMLFAFVSSIVFTLFFLAFMTIFTVKERWMLPLIGIIYSGIIGSVTEVIAYRFNLVQSMTAWTQGSFSMIQTHQYEWLFLGLIILITVWKLSQTFTIMNLGKETSESLGISYSLLEKLALFLVALTTSVTMITVGGLPFLGVIVPNLVRKRYGDNLSQTKLMVALVGANLVLACDILSRVLIRPYELSVSLLLGISVVSSLSYFSGEGDEKMQTKSKHTKLFWILIILAIGACLLYFWPITHLSAFAWKLRSQKIIVYLLVAIATGISTISFQTLTENRFLTPSILGIESFYVLLQTLLLVFESKFLQLGKSPILEFLVLLLVQSLFFLALQGYLKTLMKQDLVFILLICLALRSLFRNISTFLQVLMDPNEYDKLQNSLFASFQHLNTSILAIGSLIILALTIFFFRKAVVLDVLHLQRETAQILGLDVEKEQKELLWGIVLLTSTATSLVGPMAFFGFMLANLTYLIVKDYQHKLLFIVAILVGFISLTLGQALIERVFALEIRISMIIESVGGFLFFILLYRRARQ